MNTILNPFDRLANVPHGDANPSRCHNWKCQVLPATIRPPESATGDDMLRTPAGEVTPPGKRFCGLKHKSPS